MLLPGGTSPARKRVEWVDPTILVPANAASRQPGRLSLARGCDRSRTLMRHARSTSAFAIGLLPLVVIVPACPGGLVSAARCPQLLLPHSLPAAVAAIALAPITTRTDTEKRVARGVKTPPLAKAFNRSICCRPHRHLHHNTPGMIGPMTAPSIRFSATTRIAMVCRASTSSATTPVIPTRHVPATSSRWMSAR